MKQIPARNASTIAEMYAPSLKNFKAFSRFYGTYQSLHATRGDLGSQSLCEAFSQPVAQWAATLVP
jgi:hypothetical protein